MGIILFACMVLHIFFKRKRIKAIFSGSRKRKPSVLFSEIIIILLFVCMIIMAVSSMGVSRTVFPWFHFAGDSGFHRIMATVLLTLSVIHGGMHVFIRSRKKKTVAAGIAAGAMLSLVLGLWAVPYMNRHFRHMLCSGLRRFHQRPQTRWFCLSGLHQARSSWSMSWKSHHHIRTCSLWRFLSRLHCYRSMSYLSWL